MSKQVSGNRRKATSKTGATQFDYKKLLYLGRKAVSEMTFWIAIYPTPSPPLADITTACDNLQLAIQQLGSKYNRPKSIVTSGARAAALNVQLLLLQLQNYAKSVIGVSVSPETQKVNISQAGFVTRKMQSVSKTPPRPPQSGKQIITTEFTAPTHVVSMVQAHAGKRQVRRYIKSSKDVMNITNHSANPPVFLKSSTTNTFTVPFPDSIAIGNKMKIGVTNVTNSGESIPTFVYVTRYA